MVSALQITTIIHAPLAFVAAANNPTSTFCHLQPRPTVYTPLTTPPRFSKQGRVLHASTLPKPSGASAPGSQGKEGAGDATHNIVIQGISSGLVNGDHRHVEPGLISPESHHHIRKDSLPTSSHIETEPTILEQVQAQEQALQSQQTNDKIAIAGITLFLSLAVGAMLKHSPPGCWRYYLAGGICASTSHAITTPIDVVKTRQQVDPWLQEKSMWQATLAIVKAGGPFALLAGLGPTFIGYLIEGGVKFGIYEVSKPATQRFVASLASFFSNPALDSRILSLILCGFISGTAASMMLSPLEALRIRMVSDEEFADKNLIGAGTTMIKKEGIQSLLKGLPAMLWKQVPYTITKNASFDLLTTWLYGMWRGLGHALTANVKFAIPLVSALAAAVLSCISSHPGDMLLSLVNAHEGSKRTRDFANEIMNGKDGIRGFFVGIKPRFVHVLLIVTVQLMIYDFVKRLVGIAATGMG